MQGTDDYLQAKFQIGSCNGRMDYEENERVFHHSDVPQKSKDARKAVQSSLRSQALSNNPDWAQSTHTGAAVSATKPAPWDKSKYEDRYYAKQETEARLQAEARYTANQIAPQDDPRYVNPQWNQSTIYQTRSAPAKDVYFSKESNRAVDGSRSLRFGNESYIPVKPYSGPDGKMNTVNGETQLGTGLPIVMPFDPNASARMNRASRVQKLPINYTSLVERQKKEALRLRAEKQAVRGQQVTRQDPARTFEYPFEPNFKGTMRPDPKEIDAAINGTYTKDSLTQYLETMDLTATVKVMGGSQTIQTEVAVSQ